MCECVCLSEYVRASVRSCQRMCLCTRACSFLWGSSCPGTENWDHLNLSYINPSKLGEIRRTWVTSIHQNWVLSWEPGLHQSIKAWWDKENLSYINPSKLGEIRGYMNPSKLFEIVGTWVTSIHQNVVLSWEPELHQSIKTVRSWEPELHQSIKTEWDQENMGYINPSKLGEIRRTWVTWIHQNLVRS